MANLSDGVKTSSSHEEGLSVSGRLATKEFMGDENGNLKGVVHCRRWNGNLAEDGRPAHFVEVPGSEKEIPCELALLAMGFVHPQHEGLIS